MIRWFHRRSEPGRSEVEELQRMLCRLRKSNAQTRLAVGSGVQLANTEFLRRFGGIESFRRMSSEEQQRFASELSDLELGSRTRESGVAMGVGLYKIWLTDMLAGRTDVAEMLGEELTELSRRAASA